jgi:26S proteasome regulatory subunit N10
MPLEATMIVLDNSEYMRNGDYQPTRFGALADAVNKVFETKIDSNPENTVGVMTMANKGPEVLVTHTKELGQILDAVHKTSTNLGRTASIPTAIAIAQLALKHRQNKNLRQRVIVFVGSPLDDTSPDSERALIRLAKKLKKNNVALDVVAFGDGIEEAGEDGHSILRAFVENASSSDNSHYLAVPPGPHLLSSMILNSPILASDRGIPDELAAAVPGGMGGGAGGAGGAGGGAGTSQFEFGVDPTLDPELAMALRMSMEDEAARQAAANAQPPPPPGAAAAAPAPAPAPTPAVTAVAGPGGVSVQQQQQQQQHQPSGAAAAAPPTDESEEALLQQALALSEGHAGGAADVEMNEERDGDEDLTEEDMIARAIEMSMRPEPESEEKK